MSYTPPAGDAVDFNFVEAYTPPASDAVDFSFTDSAASVYELEIAATLPALLPSVQLYLDISRDIVIASTLPTFAANIEMVRGVALELAAQMPMLSAGLALNWGETIPGTGLIGSSGGSASGGLRWKRGTPGQAIKSLPFG
ncbi:MAG: hypothetical protein ACK4S8_14665, partial [Alishewanella aestuarii]